MPQALVSKVRLAVLSVPQAEEWSKEKWAEHLKAMAERMKSTVDIRIPTGEVFDAILAGPANLAYSNFVNPDFVSRGGQNAESIKASHHANLSEAYLKYKEQMDFLFAEVDGVPAKRFKDLVEQAKEAWSRGAASRTLPFTGVNRFVRGLVSLAGMWLTGDPRTEGYIRPADAVLVGTAKRICAESAKPSLRALLGQRLIQSGSTLVKRNWSEDGMTEENDKTNALINGYRDPALLIAEFTTGGDSHIDWIRIDDIPYLEIQVSVTP